MVGARSTGAVESARVPFQRRGNEQAGKSMGDGVMAKALVPVPSSQGFIGMFAIQIDLMLSRK
jgi:hypothetical protein